MAESSSHPVGGEDQMVAALLSRLPRPSRKHGIVVGPGVDDCAVVEGPRRGHWLLLKTDCVIEGVHFVPDTPPELVGRKALCRALSDIAATGGKPQHALVTFAVDPGKSRSWATGVYAGIGAAAEEYEVVVVGGDTASTPGPSFLSVSLTGSVRKDRCITRGGGRAGDVLFVTGSLGGSFTSGRHLSFSPRLQEGQWVAKQRGVSAMMDLSDGLAADLPRLAAASGTGYVVNPGSLPLNPGCDRSQALGDGEDYELLVAVRPKHAAKFEAGWARRFPGLSLTAIGELADHATALGMEGARGFDHFLNATKNY